MTAQSSLAEPEKELRLHDDEKSNSGTSSPRPSDLENPNDGLFHQVIVKDGKEVLVSWTQEEQARVVRKADFLFLPLFAVRPTRVQ